MKIKISILLALLLIVISVDAQRPFLEMNRNYTKAKIYHQRFGTIKAKNMMLVNDTVLQFNSTTSEGAINREQLSTSTIRFVKIKTGSFAGIGAAAGAGMGLLSAVYGVLTVKNDPSLDDSDVNWTPFILGFTAGGAVIGTIAGLCIPRWSTYYIPHGRNIYSIKIEPNILPAYCGLGLKMRF